MRSYNGLGDWYALGSDILSVSNNDIEMEKAVKYNDILTNAVVLQNMVDMTDIIAELMDVGHAIVKEDIFYLCRYSPYGEVLGKAIETESRCLGRNSVYVSHTSG